MNWLVRLGLVKAKVLTEQERKDIAIEKRLEKMESAHGYTAAFRERVRLVFSGEYSKPVLAPGEGARDS